MKLPTITIDTREQTPLQFQTFQTESTTLTTGDYSVKGLEDVLTIERKSVPDLIGSLTSGRERFNRELQRMMAMKSRTLLVIGENTNPLQTIVTGDYRSQTKPQSIMASLTSIEAKGISLKFAQSPDVAARWVESVSWYAWRSHQIAAGNPKPKTPTDLLDRLVS